MPLTQLDTNAALIVIDLQKGIVERMTALGGDAVLERAADLARSFRLRSLPVVLVNVTARAPGRTDAGIRNLSFPPDWAELVPELGQQDGDLLISKQRRGAFLGTKLDAILRERGITQVFLAGISTSAGVESTARSADDLGYNVVFIVDAMADSDAEIHRFCVEKIFPKLGETETTANVLAKLA
jgi:nicotinamidase-related amidase